MLTLMTKTGINFCTKHDLSTNSQRVTDVGRDLNQTGPRCDKRLSYQYAARQGSAVFAACFAACKSLPADMFASAAVASLTVIICSFICSDPLGDHQVVH